MKLIGLFGVLLAISSAVCGAATIKCPGGGMATSTVGQCNNEPCTFGYVEVTKTKTSYRAYRSCSPPDKGVNCWKIESMEECLSHQCSYVKIIGKRRSSKLQCRPEFKDGFVDQSPRAIEPFQ